MILLRLAALAIAGAMAIGPAWAQSNPGQSPQSIAKGGTGATTASGARTNLGVAIGTNVQAWDTDLDCIAALSSSGMVARTGAGTCAARTLTAPAAGITVSNGDGVSGNPTIALANDLAALEALSSTGFAVRTATDTWAQRSFSVPTGLSITNPTGIAGNPTIAWNIAALTANGAPAGGSTFVPCETAGTMQKCDVADLGVGGSGGMTTAERQNFLLSLIYQSKSFAGYRRVIGIFADGYKASDGVNAGSSSNHFVDTSSGFLRPTLATTAYDSGDRTGTYTITTTASLGSGTINNLIDGGTGQNSTDSIVWTGGQSSKEIKIDFGSSKVLDEIKWQQNTTDTHGTWKVQASPDDIVAYVDIGSTFTLGGINGTQTITTPNGNTTAYRYYKLTQTAGSTSGSPFIQEVTFKIASPPLTNNMTMISTTMTPDASSSSGRVLVEYDDTCGSCNSVTLNTDLTVDITCNGGSNWAAATLSSAGTGQAGRKVTESSATSVTAGTSCAARLKTLNNKFINVYGLTLSVQ
jgi:hypothetical protein